MASKRDKQLDKWETLIRNAMAHTLWITSYADYADELTQEERDEQEIRRPGPGGDWADAVPEMPHGAHEAARDLAELFGRSENIGRRRPMVTLFDMAHHADTGEALELDRMFGTEDKPGPQWELFGHYMVMMALGHGVSWFDDHKEFDLEVPRFECHFDGVELSWNGSVAQGHDAGHVHGMHARYGWDSVAFGPDGFESVLRSLRIKKAPRVIKASVGRVGGRRAWYWEGRGIEIVTEVNPVTGQRAGQEATTFRKDYAGAMTVRGMSNKVVLAVQLVDQHALRQMHGGPTTASIDFGDLEGPKKLRNPCDATTCTAEYHQSLKDDPAKWRELEFMGAQERKHHPGKMLEFRNCGRCHTTMAITLDAGAPKGRP